MRVRHIITLSSIPPRFDKLGPALTSLLRQSARAEAVELYIPRSYRRFPQWGGALPEVPDGVTIVRVDEDLGPATKVLPAARAWRKQDVELIYVDDDRVFARDWVALCLARRKEHPGMAICGAGFGVERFGYRNPEALQPQAIAAIDPRLQLAVALNRLRQSLALPGLKPKTSGKCQRFARSGHVDIAEGYGGVMVQPGFFDAAAYEIPPILWTVDDVWLSGMMMRRGIPIWADASLCDVREVIDTSLHHPLFKAVIDGAGRHEANRACVDYMRRTFRIWGGAADQST